MPPEQYRAAVEVAREHILAGDIFQVVLAQRFDLAERHDPFDVYRVLRQVNPSPYMYYVRHPEATLVGSSPEPMVQLTGRRVISRPIAGTGGAAAPTPTTAAWPPSSRNIRRSGPSTSCSSTCPQRRGPGREVRHRAGGRADGARALLPCDAPHQPGGGRTPGRAQRGRRVARHVPGGHGQRRAEGPGDGDHRCDRTHQARAVRGGGRLHRLLGQPRHRHRDPHDGLAQRAGQRAGRRRDRGRFGARRRRPRVPQQGAGAHRRGGGTSSRAARPVGP